MNTKHSNDIRSLLDMMDDLIVAWDMYRYSIGMRETKALVKLKDACTELVEAAYGK